MKLPRLSRREAARRIFENTEYGLDEADLRQAADWDGLVKEGVISRNRLRSGRYSDA